MRFSLNLCKARPEEKRGVCFMKDKNNHLQSQELTNCQKKPIKNNMSYTKRIVGTAVFAALAYVVSMFEFPIFPATPFLKLDFSAVFILLAGFMFGLPFGLGACAVKEFVCFITKSSTGGVGEIANFIVISGYILIPTLVYMYRKGIKTVVLTLLLGCVVQVILSLLANRFVNFPLYMGDKAQDVFNSVWYFILLFNLIKSVAVSLITIILYKRLSGFIKRI